MPNEYMCFRSRFRMGHVLKGQMPLHRNTVVVLVITLENEYGFVCVFRCQQKPFEHMYALNLEMDIKIYIWARFARIYIGTERIKLTHRLRRTVYILNIS